MKIAVIIFVFMFILLRPYVIQSGFWYYGDDQDYFAHTSSIVFGQFPSYKKEYLTINPQYPQGSIGCALLSLPFVWGFSLIDRWMGSTIVVERTGNNIPGSWTQFGFVVASCFYFSLACFLLYRGMLYCIEERYAWLSIVVTVCCQGLPLFAMRRPIFSHTAEFFLQSVFIFLILRNSVSNKKFPHVEWQYVLLGALSALVFLTRYNNIGFALMNPLMVLFSAGIYLRSKRNWRPLIFLLIMFIAMVGIFKTWPEISNQNHPYQWAQSHLLINVSLIDLYRRLGHIFVGLDWGLVYTAPYILLGFLSLCILNDPVRKYLLWLLAALGIDFYIIVIWGSQGGWYGYRYFIASAIPIVVLPVALLIKKTEQWIRQKLTLYWSLIAVPPALSMFCFEGNNTHLDLYNSPQNFGFSDISNNLYQVHVWQTVLFKPQEFIEILSKGGIEYLEFLLIHLFQKAGFSTNAYFKLYCTFDPVLLIKVILIYVIPFVTAYVFFRIFKMNKI